MAFLPQGLRRAALDTGVASTSDHPLPDHIRERIAQLGSEIPAHVALKKLLSDQCSSQDIQDLLHALSPRCSDNDGKNKKARSKIDNRNEQSYDLSSAVQSGAMSEKALDGGRMSITTPYLHLAPHVLACALHTTRTSRKSLFRCLTLFPVENLSAALCQYLQESVRVFFFKKKIKGGKK